MSRDKNVAGDIVSLAAVTSSAQRLPMVQHSDIARMLPWPNYFISFSVASHAGRAVKFTRTLGAK